ncbi:MAG: NAD-binding protein [Rhodothermales bacterium]
MSLRSFLRASRRPRGPAHQNLRIILGYVGGIFLLVSVFAILFHVIMIGVEGRSYSWFTAYYWTLTVMTTLGFGDIVFESEIGRLYTIVVLVSGITLFFVLFPVAFIRFGPWLDARLRMRAPRSVPRGTAGHVILTAYDEMIAPALIARLERESIDVFVLEPDADKAAQLYFRGVPAVTGDIDLRATYEALAVASARMVVVNRDDAVNTSTILAVREAAEKVPIVALASRDDAVDVLQLTGATRVLALRNQLGEQLASRVKGMHARVVQLGEFHDLQVAEFPVHRTPLAAQTVRDTRLRELTGVTVIGVWDRGTLLPARPETQLTSSSVLVVVGASEQLDELDALMMIYDVNPNPVIVIGGGTVGAQAARVLKARGVPVRIIDQSRFVCSVLAREFEHVHQGDAADYTLMQEVGIAEAPSVLLTTHDDRINIYLTSYCRRLNPGIRIVSRLNEERNVASIHRAGADFALSYTSLGVSLIDSILRERPSFLVSEGVNLFSVPTPASIAGRLLKDSGIRTKSGLNVIAIQEGDHIVTNPPPSALIPKHSELFLMGDIDQQRAFEKAFG